MTNPIIRHILQLKRMHPKKTYRQIITKLIDANPQHGAGIRTVVRAAIHRVRTAIKGPRADKFPPAVRNWIAKKGDLVITKMEVSRVPIVKAIDIALSWITAGEWDKGKHKMGYSDMFHLYAVLHLKDGEVFKIEKNHVVQITHGQPSGSADTKPVSVKSGLTFGELMQNAVKYRGNDLFVYDAVNANCQDFVSSLLRGSGMMTPELDSFINQDAKAVIDKKWHPIAKAVTDVAGAADILQNGEGRNKSHKLIFV